MELTNELREQMVLELAEFSTDKGWDPSLTLLIACDLANIIIANEMKDLDPEHSKAVIDKIRALNEFIKQRIDQYPANRVIKIITISNVLSQLILELAKESVEQR